MTEFDRLQLIFAHNSEPVPAEFVNYGKPPHKALSQRLTQKWHSRRLAHFLLHQLFAQHDLDTALLTNLQKTASGRPYVLHPNVDFNISHSGEWVAVLFRYSSSKKVVGLDIEHPQKERRYQALLEHFAHAPEIAEIQNTAIQPQLESLEQRFYLSWCLREAVLKSQGIGIVKLSEVRHHLAEQKIISSHCPQGKLFFYHQLPFYLAYFSEQGKMAEVFEWRNGQLEPKNQFNPMEYKVNHYEPNSSI